MIGRSSPEDEEVEEDREGGFDGFAYLGFLHPHVGTRSPYSFCIASSENWPKISATSNSSVLNEATGSLLCSPFCLNS